MGLEHRAGRADEAAARLFDYLRAYGSNDYIRPLVRERETSLTILEALLDSELGAGVREIADAALEQLGTQVAGPAQAQHYTAREVEVLQCLSWGERDKEIARRLGITASGVRYHLQKIYRKLGAAGRVDAVRRALSQGLIRSRSAGNGNG